jgi:hypothetical protein
MLEIEPDPIVVGDKLALVFFVRHNSVDTNYFPKHVHYEHCSRLLVARIK